MKKRICGNCWYWSPSQPERATCKECREKSDDTARKHFYPRDTVCQVCDEQSEHNQVNLGDII